MSTHKTVFTDIQAESFLNSYFKTDNIKFERIGMGEESQAFYFSLGGEDYVLRVTRHGIEGYMKDKIAFEEFSSETLRIPEVVNVGEVDKQISFIITERAKGSILGDSKSDGAQKLKSRIIKVLAEVHSIEVPGEGYGGWGLNRNGPFKSWKDYLRASLVQDESVFEGKDFYDAPIHQRIKGELEKLIMHCPEDRAILHGDFGGANIISDGGNIVILDWEDSLYGDPLWDVANFNFGEEFREYYESKGGVPSKFEERIFCYRLLSFYRGLWFYAYSNQAESYIKCRDNAELLIEALT